MLIQRDDTKRQLSGRGGLTQPPRLISIPMAWANQRQPPSRAAAATERRRLSGGRRPPTPCSLGEGSRSRGARLVAARRDPHEASCGPTIQIAVWLRWLAHEDALVRRGGHATGADHREWPRLKSGWTAPVGLARPLTSGSSPLAWLIPPAWCTRGRSDDGGSSWAAPGYTGRLVYRHGDEPGHARRQAGRLVALGQMARPHEQAAGSACKERCAPQPRRWQRGQTARNGVRRPGHPGGGAPCGTRYCTPVHPHRTTAARTARCRYGFHCVRLNFHRPQLLSVLVDAPPASRCGRHPRVGPHRATPQCSLPDGAVPPRLDPRARPCRTAVRTPPRPPRRARACGTPQACHSAPCQPPLPSASLRRRGSWPPPPSVEEVAVLS